MPTKKEKIKKIYKRNFLKSVIFRIDFEQTKLDNLNAFSKSITPYFPLQEQKREHTALVELKDGKIINQSKEENFYWQYLNATKDKTLTISSRYLHIDYAAYKNSDNLFADIEKVVAPFLKSFNVEMINRLGLRYVNQIDFKEVKEGFAYKKYFNEKLLGSLEFAIARKEKIGRQMTQLYLKKEDADLTYNYGVWNNDFPNENTRKEFLMDFDCFSKFPISTGDENIVEATKKYNLYIQDLFEASIKEEFRNFLDRK